uniref:CCHC-type domain-containing protein n=1 Tax=Brassica campestris TaxID=3711 RepID=M4DXV4_BRACM
MPPRKRVVRTQTARVAREAEDEHVHLAVPQQATPPIDQEAMRQMVQDAARQAAQDVVQQIAQEAARQSAQEAARVAAQEVSRQMAAVQQAPQVQVQQGPQIRVQQAPPAQVQQDQQIPAQHDYQDPVQQVPLPQVPLQQGPAQQFAHGVQDLPPPPPRPHVYPVYDERFYRLTRQMRNMDMEHFSGTVDAVAAHDWKLALQRKLEIIECPPELSLRLTMQYLRGDALIWWEGIRLSHLGPERLTFADFIREFDTKYFSKEAMDMKKCEFAGEGILEEDLMRKILNGMRAGLAEEKKYSKAVQPKVGGTSEAQQRTWDKPSIQCFYCGKMGHKSRVCRSRLFDAQVAPRAAAASPVVDVRNCFGCNQPVHIFNCPRRGNAVLPPPLKRLAIAPRAFAVGDPHGAEPIAAVATDHAAIGVWTKPLEPLKVSPLRARELHAPPPESPSSTVTAGKPSQSPSVTVAGDSLMTRQPGRVDLMSQLGDSVNRLRNMRCDNYCPRCGEPDESVTHAIFEGAPALQAWSLSATPTSPDIFLFNANEMVPRIPQDHNIEEPQVLSLDNICMIDGSWTSTSQFSGCGWVWLDSLGKVQLMGTKIYPRRESPLHSEVEARRWAMESMLQHSTCQCFRTDCKDLIPMIKEPHAWPSFAGELERKETMQICFPDFKIIHIP